jgi:hypothetical protein
MWGAARHDRATGIHQRLLCDVIICGPLEAGGPLMVRGQLDLVGLVQAQHQRLRLALSDAAGVALDQVVLTYSHTHAAGHFAPDRFTLPGGELIAVHLEQIEAQVRTATRAALDSMREATIEYAITQCTMAANRDYWDEARRRYVCGFNPDAPGDTTLVFGRITDQDGEVRGTLVHYACHPTTLAWENSLISPDYVGTLRQLVETSTGQPCVFLLGACGELGPRDGFVGELAVAERNGRQVGYAALAALSSLGLAGTDYAYQGPVVSGATLGIWRHVPVTGERLQAAAWWQGGTFTVNLALKERPDPAALRQEIQAWEAKAAALDAQGDALQARDCAAYAERARRWLAQMDDFPPGTSYPLSYSVHTMGDVVWVTCGGEPYSEVQQALRQRFPAHLVLVSPLSGDMQMGYLLPVGRYGRGLYQEEPSILAAGCLETLIAAIGSRILELLPHVAA